MIYISAVGMLNALGRNMDEIADNLSRNVAPGMQPQHGWLQHEQSEQLDQSGQPEQQKQLEQPCWLAGIECELPDIPASLAKHASRNNQLLLAALEQIRAQVDAAIRQFGNDRVAVILGTSTSGLNEGDRRVSAAQGSERQERDSQASDIQLNESLTDESTVGYHYYQQELGDPARFLARYLDLAGPAFTLSTACTSSARAIISGRRLLDAGLADVVIVGGADTLSRMPINGFNSLESLSLTRCQPFAEARQGITIGEASVLMLLTREPQAVALLGVGESSDAWHMSAPHPEGVGAVRAISQALADAALSPADIGYINLHGTATQLNDQIESRVVQQLFGNTTACSSTKHLTGHTLGAAGACEAALCWLLLTRDLMLPAQDFSSANRDASLPDCGLLIASAPLTTPVIMSNSFAFGGNNTSLIFGKKHA